MTVNENSKPLLTVKGLKQYFKVSNTCGRKRKFSDLSG